MPYIFKSKVHSDILMLNEDAQKILKILGKDGQKKGIIEPQNIPTAIHALKQAIAYEQQSHNSDQEPIAENRIKTLPEDTPILLAQRTWPFLEMLNASYAANTAVVWGI